MDDDENYVIRSCGKWILAGEYAVLKSHPALVFPFPNQFMELSYQKNKTPCMNVRLYKNPHKNPHKRSKKNLITCHQVFKNLLDQALKKIFKRQSDLEGSITLNICMPLGAGAGASAVLCVLVGLLFCRLKWLKKEHLFSFCHSLEETLHGRSSGVDIAGVLEGKPILYIDKPQIQKIQPLWKPRIFLSHSKIDRSTKDNIKAINVFWKQQPRLANQLNQQMTQAVLRAKEGLETTDQEKGMFLLSKSFSLAEQCFKQWGLINHNMKVLMKSLTDQGAVAVKPTGSGNGGYILSLWPSDPPAGLREQLLPAF